MHIDIIGTGLTASSYDWGRDSYKWSVSSFHEIYADNVDLYFSMHEGQVLGLNNEITLASYPLQDIQKEYDTNYFSSSIAYMIAYALYTGAKTINVYGVDMEHDTEYRYQRPCLAYWIGFAKAKGVSVTLSTVLDKVPYKYGYDTSKMNETLDVLNERMLASFHKAKETEGREADQWLGSYHAHQKIIELLRG